jgi:hypothetical protein
MRAGLLVVFAACTVPPPFHVLETPETLERRQLSLTAGVGGGTGDRVDACCGGAAARVRVGIGNEQEVGIDGDLVFSKSTLIGGFKLAYKKQARPHLAFVAGPGLMFGGDSGKRIALGADVGAIVSTELGTDATLYGALRFSFAMPARSDVYATGGLSEALVLPIGVAYPFGNGARVLGEVGGIGALTQARDAMSVVTTETAVGFYAAVALSVTR